MGVFDSSGVNDDTSIVFRKCWSLGEAFYILENYYDCLFKYSNSESDYPKLIRTYQSQLVALNSICDELGIEDSKIKAFTEKMNLVLNAITISNSDVTKKRLYAPINFEVELESYLIGNLIGKDPRYDHIFRIGKHSMDLYKTDLKEDSNENYPNCGKPQKLDQLEYNILTDLENIKNILSRDKFRIIQEIIANWEKIKNEMTKKDSYLDYNSNDNTYYDKIKSPDFIEIINRIRGLVTGTIGINDFLNRQDRISWIIISIFFITGIFSFIGLMAFMICYFFKLDMILYFNNFVFSKQSGLNVPLFTAMAGFLLACIKTARPLWQKWSDWLNLRIAMWRIKNPYRINVFLLIMLLVVLVPFIIVYALYVI